MLGRIGETPGEASAGAAADAGGRRAPLRPPHCLN